MSQHLYSAVEVADRLDVPLHQVRFAATSLDLALVRVGRVWRYRPEHVDTILEFLKELEQHRTALVSDLVVDVNTSGLKLARGTDEVAP